ncbi:MAG: GGDEF domain-containing protein [Rhizobacter sp.]
MTSAHAPWPPTASAAPRELPAPTAAEEEATRDAAERTARRRAQWRQDTRVVAVSYGLNGLCLALFAAIGTVHWSAPLLYILPGWLVCLVATQLIARGRSVWQDPSLSMLHAVAGMAICLLGMALYPEVGFFHVLVLFTIFVGATYRMPRDKTNLAWMVVSAGMALAMLSGDRRLQVPHANALEQVLAGLCFAATLARCLLLSVVNLRNNLLLRERGQQMAEALAEIERLANGDELTGLPNRRSMLRSLDDEIARAAREQTPVCIALLDIDHFKRINDVHGHAVGDDALRRFAAVAQAHLRATDRFGRHGGEEFLWLMPDTSPADAELAVARLREGVAATDWQDVADGLRLRFSAGLADLRPGEGAEQLLSRADRALYGAKHAGRDRHHLG